MGTLDDAIREHLELKRKAGTSADEVRKLESEALGPARRDAAPLEPAAEPTARADAAPATETAPDVPEPAREPDPSPVAREPLSPAEPSAPVPAPVPEPPARPEIPSSAPAGGAEDPDWLEDDPFGDAGPTPETTGNPRSDYVAPDEEGEDLLEETPDFLQETPEHDRLWFEQKPPRDFDFDN